MYFTIVQEHYVFIGTSETTGQPETFDSLMYFKLSFRK